MELCVAKLINLEVSLHRKQKIYKHFITLYNNKKKHLVYIELLKRKEMMFWTFWILPQLIQVVQTYLNKYTDVNNTFITN